MRIWKPITAQRCDATDGAPDANRPARAIRTIPDGILLLALRVYKLAFSPLYAGSCRFLPSCSDYATEAIMRHGAIRGGSLTIRRLCRCHPFGRPGHDPVPVLSEPRGFSGRGHTDV